MLQKIVLSSSLILFLFACSDEIPTESTSNSNLAKEVVGNFISSKFILTLENQSPIDILSVGGYIEIELNDDQKTKGLFYLPDTLGLTGGGEMSFNLSGTYVIKNNKIIFNHSADTFIKNVEFSLLNSKLTGKYEKTGVLVEVELLKK